MGQVQYQIKGIIYSRVQCRKLDFERFSLREMAAQHSFKYYKTSNSRYFVVSHPRNGNQFLKL